MSKHSYARKTFESYFPPPDGMVWDDKMMHYRRNTPTILLGDCMKWDRMLQVWLTAAKYTKKKIKKSK